MLYNFKPPTPSQYFISPDQAFSTKMDFEELVKFLKDFSEEEKDYPIDDNMLIIEIPEGVFIRSQNTKWCESLHALTEEDSDFEIIGIQKWEDITRAYRDPLKHLGNLKLGTWKLGFSF